MKIIIAGGRDFNQKGMMKRILIQYGVSSEDEIVSGHCPTGADALGEELAKYFKASIKLFPADWNKYGKSAGSRNMIQEMKKRNKPVEVINY